MGSLNAKDKFSFFIQNFTFTVRPYTMRFSRIPKALAKHILKYYEISQCALSASWSESIISWFQYIMSTYQAHKLSVCSLRGAFAGTASISRQRFSMHPLRSILSGRSRMLHRAILGVDGQKACQEHAQSVVKQPCYDARVRVQVREGVACGESLSWRHPFSSSLGSIAPWDPQAAPKY